MTKFEPPGPGGWKRLADHFPGALTSEYQLIYAAACADGMAAYMEAYGVLARGVDSAFVHGHLYITPIPLVGSREPSRTPPTFAVWLLSRLHPAFRSRTRAARRALAERPWRSAAERWFSVERATWVERVGALQATDPGGLDDAALADHVRRARALALAGYRRHFELHGDDLLPIGLLIARGTEWGIAPAVVMSALAGASPEASGARGAPPWQLVTGYDVDSLAWCELGAPRGAAARTADPAEPIDLRPLVPPADRAELDVLVADARAAVPLRDDNGLVIGAWPMGLLRRAMLEAGRRLGFRRPEHAVELTVDELVAGLTGAGGPSPGEAADRAARRRIDSARHAPLQLGPEFAIPPLSALPRPLAVIGAAQLASAEHMLAPLAAPAVGIGDRPHTGRAVVVDDPNEALDLIEPGDVLITAATSPSWIVVLVQAGALVTTTGGLLSHAAVIARELGIPALIGESTARQRVTTGTMVTVDPVAGRMTTAATAR